MSGTADKSASGHAFSNVDEAVHTSHKRPHRIDQVDQLCLDTCVILHTASKCGFTLC